MSEVAAVIRIVTLKNKYGMHARPAMQFVEIASRYESKLIVIKDGKDVDGKSIMGMMTLAAEKGADLTLKANGNDADEMLARIADLIDNKFGEE